MSRVAEAGAIAVKTDGPATQFLVVTAKKNPAHWIFPKGHIDPGETPEQAALRELEEEAGVQGVVVGPVGSSTFRSGDEEIEVQYYLVRAVAESPSEEARQRRWLIQEEARAWLTFDDLRDLLDETARLLERR